MPAMIVESAPPLTASDYRRLTPEFGVPGALRYQLVEGELLPMSAPNRFHQEISGNLFWFIASYLRQHPIGVVYAAPFDVYLDEHNVFQPDLLFVSRERAASVLVPEGVRGAPDLVVEILSPSTAALDRRAKRRAYARAGTLELWLIEPERRTVEVFALDQDAEQPAAVLRLPAADEAHDPEEGGGVFLEIPRLLPGLRIVLAEVFATRLG